jgi:hypothetical protein
VRCQSLVGSRAAATKGFEAATCGNFDDFGLELDKSPFEQPRQRSARSSPVTDPDLEAAYPAPPVATMPPPSASLDDFESQTIAAELNRIRRRFDSPASDPSSSAIPAAHFDRHSPRNGVAVTFERALHERSRKSAAADQPPPTHHKPRRSSPLAWSATALGLMAFVCGAILLGWSLATGRSQLWNVGLPIALIGQFALLFGLIWQLDGLWQGNRDAAEKLDNVDGRLDDLKKTAALLTTAHSSPAQQFYVHMAGGAGPQLLLADLKGQLDLLAMQMADERR